MEATNDINISTSLTQTPTIDLPWCISFLEKRGRELWGEKFTIQAQDNDVIAKLIVYFLGNPVLALRYGIDIDKGILLTGPIGCGKTSLMTLMRFVSLPEKKHIMKSCRDISFEFIQEGYEVIYRYSKMSYNIHNPKVYCFDDLGTEQSLKYYGNDCNVMGEILMSRYDCFISTRMLTHVTTNLSANEIEDVYGNRMRSRMREMLNLISFDNSTKDKRV